MLMPLTTIWRYLGCFGAWTQIRPVARTAQARELGGARINESLPVPLSVIMMPKSDSLEGFFRDKHEKAVKEGNFDWTRRLDAWHMAVHKLYDSIGTWLAPSINAHHVEVTRESVSLTEERIGSYRIDALNIKVGDDRVSLVPVGTLILGGNGRVDVKGSAAEGMLVVDVDWNWSIVNRTPKRTLVPLTEESFLALLQQVMRP